MKCTLHTIFASTSFRPAVLSLALLSAVAAPPTAGQASAGALERMKETGKITLGYRTDAPPFSYQDQSGKPGGYSVDLCQGIAEEAKTQLGLSSLALEWVPVALDQRFEAVQQGKVDLLCAADTLTLERRKTVSFSIPIFPSGIGAVLSTDAQPALAQVLSGKPDTDPVWRGSPARILNMKTFAIVKGTRSEKWLPERIDAFQVSATIVPVESYAAGIKLVLNHSADVLFGDRPILLDAAAGNGGELNVLDRLFTYEPLALALQREDEDFRLVVDTALSRVFSSPDINELYRKWFGVPDSEAAKFFRWTSLPE